MDADLHRLARAVTEVLDDDPQALAVRVRIDPHGYADGDLGVRRAAAWRFSVGPTHGYARRPRQLVKHTPRPRNTYEAVAGSTSARDAAFAFSGRGHSHDGTRWWSRAPPQRFPRLGLLTPPGS